MDTCSSCTIVLRSIDDHRESECTAVAALILSFVYLHILDCAIPAPAIQFYETPGLTIALQRCDAVWLQFHLFVTLLDSNLSDRLGKYVCGYVSLPVYYLACSHPSVYADVRMSECHAEG